MEQDCLAAFREPLRGFVLVWLPLDHSKPGKQEVERSDDGITVSGDRCARVAERALAHRYEFLGDEYEGFSFYLDARIESVGKRPGESRFERRDHDGVQSAHQQITLQSDKKRLTFSTAGERIIENIELFHRRSQTTGFVRKQAVLPDP